MSELMERRWAVVSERGSEATDLTFDEAHALVLSLSDDGTHGLCVVTSETARHFLREGSTPRQTKQPVSSRGSSR